MNLRPGVFESEDQIKHEEISRKMRFSIILALFGFISTSAYRVHQIKTRNKDIWSGIGVIMMSYLPAMVYYSYYKREYQVFLADVS